MRHLNPNEWSPKFNPKPLKERKLTFIERTVIERDAGGAYIIKMPIVYATMCVLVALIWWLS
jgi:hypothetical protein